MLDTAAAPASVSQTGGRPLALLEATPLPLSGQGRWIWSDPSDPTPVNRFTWFRATVELDELPADGRLLFAADSNAWLWINGHVVRRKVTRYHEGQITGEVVGAGPYLRRGTNVVLVLHHNWGDIVTFQRSGQRHAGLFLDSAWLHSDANWRWHLAPEFLAHEQQIGGLALGAKRVRFPQVIDLARRLAGDPSSPDYTAEGWQPAVEVSGGPWGASPEPVETPGQRESFQPPLGVVAAGWAAGAWAADDPMRIAEGITRAQLHPEESLTRAAAALVAGAPLRFAGPAGSTCYVTLDFHRPLHGFPLLEWAEATPGVVIDLGYGEIARTLYDGRRHVEADGWLDTEGVVGHGYADRVMTAAGAGAVTLPDERTARWLTLHIHFREAGEVTFERVGFIKSQYALRPRGSFQCGDERVEQIAKLCQIHAEVTMSDTYVDTPGREDGQWIEDARPRALVSERWFGDVALRRLMIRTLAEGQGADGHLHPFAPSNFPAYPATIDWSQQWVAMLYDDYQWTGQTDFLARFWPNLRAYWTAVVENTTPFSNLDADGLWCSCHLLGDLRTSRNPETMHQSSGVVTPWLIDRLRWSAEMARALGHTEQAEAWDALAQRMSATFRERHLMAATGTLPRLVGDRLDPENPAAERGLSQAGHTIAILAGLLTREEARAAVDTIFPDPDGTPPAGVARWNNPTWAYRVLRAMSDTGRTERAVRHLIERYAPYLAGNPRNTTLLALQGSYGGPLPEYWISREDAAPDTEGGLAPGQINKAHPCDETGSHGWGAVPLLWLHDTLLGVRLAEPGGARLTIAPQTGGLPFVAGTTMTPHGAVWVYYDPQQWSIEVELPSGVQAELLLPEAFIGKRVRDESDGQTFGVGGERSVTLDRPGLHRFSAQ